MTPDEMELLSSADLIAEVVKAAEDVRLSHLLASEEDQKQEEKSLAARRQRLKAELMRRFRSHLNKGGILMVQGALGLFRQLATQRCISFQEIEPGTQELYERIMRQHGIDPFMNPLGGVHVYLSFQDPEAETCFRVTEGVLKELAQQACTGYPGVTFSVAPFHTAPPAFVDQILSWLGKPQPAVYAYDAIAVLFWRKTVPV